MKISKNLFFAFTFLLLIMGFGFLSFNKLVRFYSRGEVDYNEWTPNLGSKLETDIATTFFEKIGFVNLNGALSNFLKQPKMHGVVKLNNGYLAVPVRRTCDETLHEYADATAKFNEYLKSKNIALVYAACPYTISKYDSELPIGIEDYGNDNIDRFIADLKSLGVDTIDFRENMHEDGINHYDMMYKTDHHWTTGAGFYAYGILEKYIVEKTGCEVDERISNIDNYTVTTYPKWHLGSRGQLTGIYYAGIDDFDLIIPNFETKLEKADGQVGSMPDLMINMGPLENKNYMSRYTYDWVQGTAGTFTNLESRNDVKILMISDSFSSALNQYLAMGFKGITYVYDLHSSEVTGDLIEDFDPDVVIMMYNIDMYGENSTAFSFEAINVSKR